MRKYIPLIAFVDGMLIGVFATATFMTRRSPAPKTKGTMRIIDTEHMIIARQYDLHRQNGEWASPNSIATYWTSFDRTFTDRMGNRVDAYEIKPMLGHSSKYIVVGLFPNGYTRYLEQRDELHP
jgi:hypothetical protein